MEKDTQMPKERTKNKWLEWDCIMNGKGVSDWWEKAVKRKRRSMDKVQQIYKFPGSVTVCVEKSRWRLKLVSFLCCSHCSSGLTAAIPIRFEKNVHLQMSACVHCIRRIRVFRLRQFPYNYKGESSQY